MCQTYELPCHRYSLFVLAFTNSITCILKATCHIDKFDSGNLQVIIYKHQDTYPTDHAASKYAACQTGKKTFNETHILLFCLKPETLILVIVRFD